MKKPLYTKYDEVSANNYVSVESDGTEKMYSYDTLIGIRHPDGSLELTSYWKASQTTNYYRKQWTGYNLPETRKLIEQGKIKLV